MKLYLGIDFGTSGARAIAIAPNGTVQAEAQYPFSSEAATDWTTHWQTALFALIEQIPVKVRQDLRAIAIDGTSSTVLLCDRTGTPVEEPLLYNDARGAAVMEIVQAIAPPKHGVLSATSSFAKLLWWWQQGKLKQTESAGSETNRLYFLHQADWLASLLHGKLGISDYHNSLKLGYDVAHFRYPDWLQHHPIASLVPQVVAPGTPIAPVTADVSDRLSLPQDCLVCAGTTDSNAAFLASGATTPGEAVTSLGSTLVLKLLSQTRVDDAHYGIYSHRLGNLWLVGGASNTGGAVLKQFFSVAELEELSCQIQPEQPSCLDYYPLPQPGERFPINDSELLPRLEPRPDNPVEFLHGLLESMARIEAQGYQRLQELGASPLTQVYTAGGGAVNSAWTAIRARHLQVPLVCPTHTEAAYGAALLALRGASQT
jgi:sugar (pentulose or hexulose) kinase